jgi:hypothetical protein
MCLHLFAELLLAIRCLPAELGEVGARLDVAKIAPELNTLLVAIDRGMFGREVVEPFFAQLIGGDWSLPPVKQAEIDELAQRVSASNGGGR